MKLFSYLILLNTMCFSFYLFDGNTQEYINDLVEQDDQ